MNTGEVIKTLDLQVLSARVSTLMNLIAYINRIPLAITVLIWLALTVRTYEGENTYKRPNENIPRNASLSFLLIRRLVITGTGRSKRNISAKTSVPQSHKFMLSSLMTQV